MAQRLTLSELQTQIGLAADVTITASGRYSTTMVNLWINQAIQEAQLLRVRYHTADAAITTATITATDVPQMGGYLEREVAALPADFLAIESVYLVIGSIPERRQLLPVTASDEEANWSNGQPLYYALLDAGQTGTARLRVWPPADQNYSLQIKYYPEHPTLVNGTDNWEFAPGTQDLVIAKAAMNLLGRDGTQEPAQYQDLQRRYNDAMQALIGYCKRDPGLRTMRNTRDYRGQWRKL